MTDSRTTHGVLTEGVRKTMSGKGREGKGREQGKEECGHLTPHRRFRYARVSDGLVKALTRP